MKALAKTKRKEGLELIDVSEPTITNKDDVIVEIKATSICGTDRHIFSFNQWAQERIKKIPLILGHELSGEVVDKGRGVKKIEIGDRVAFESHIFCQKCQTCLSGASHLCDNLEILGIDTDGGFRKYIKVPEKILFKVDFPLSWEEMAVLEPFGNALYCVSPDGEKLDGKSVLIIGCGPAGILSAVASKALGAKKVILLGPDPYRLKLARKMGIKTIDILKGDPEKKALKENNCLKFDIGLEMVGLEKVFHQLLSLVRKCGRISAFGLISGNITLNLTNQIIFQGLTIRGINGRLIPETWNLALSLLRAKKVNFSPLITHRFKLTDFKRAFDVLKRQKAGKVVLIP